VAALALEWAVEQAVASWQLSFRQSRRRIGKLAAERGAVLIVADAQGQRHRAMPLAAVIAALERSADKGG